MPVSTRLAKQGQPVVPQSREGLSGLRVGDGFFRQPRFQHKGDARRRAGPRSARAVLVQAISVSLGVEALFNDAEKRGEALGDFGMFEAQHTRKADEEFPKILEQTPGMSPAVCDQLLKAEELCL